LPINVQPTQYFENRDLNINFAKIISNDKRNGLMNILLFLGSLGITEIVVIALIVLLLFGGKKIPELMKGLGKGVKSFKDGVKGIEDDINSDSATDASKNKPEA